jgi:hypothetical protein
MALLVIAGLIVGAGLGFLVGRLTAPTVDEQVAAVHEDARQITAQLRVLSLHSESGAASLSPTSDAGAALALRRADDELNQTFTQAPWIPQHDRAAVHQRMQELERHANQDAANPAFGAATEQLAADIDEIFGISG